MIMSSYSICVIYMFVWHLYFSSSCLLISLYICRFTKVIASLLSVVVIAINIWFVVDFLNIYMTNQWWMYVILVAMSLFYFSLVFYLTLFLFMAFGISFCFTIPVSDLHASIILFYTLLWSKVMKHFVLW